MNGFLSFLATDDSESLANKEGFDMFGIQVDELIFSWLRKYIRIYNPGYSFEEVMDKINAVDVSNESIRFQLLNPYTNAYENFRFWVDILDYIQRETQDLVKKTFYDSEYIEDKIFSITPETLSVISSWLPYIIPEKIISVQIRSGKKDVRNSWPGKQYDYLQVYYYWENGEVRNKQLPTLRKWEFQGTKQGILHIMGIERGRIMRLLLKKK